jgi:hypothetical protein
MTKKFGNTAIIVDAIKGAFPATDSASVCNKEVSIPTHSRILTPFPIRPASDYQ